MTSNAEARDLQKRLARLDPTALGEALGAAATRQLDELTRGITAYRHSTFRRTLTEPPVVWKEGRSRLLDYGGSGPSVLFVPSLINRAHILDLDAERSLLRWMATQGLRPLLLDWGAPGRLEESFDLAAYADRLGRALRAQDEPVHLAGYCMGGLLALMAAVRHEVRSLALLATPWDFHAVRREQAQQVAALYRLWQPLAEQLRHLPVDAIQTLFTLADPLGPQRKFRKFATTRGKTNQAGPDESFVALEDWINDGIPLAKPVADDCLIGLYGDNRPQRFVDPGQVDAPILLLVPTIDRIVPPESARALARARPDATLKEVPLGHVGMIVSQQAPRRVWQPLAKWLRAA